MLSFLSRTDALDWRQDPDYLAAVAAVTTAQDAVETLQPEADRLWARENVQGVNPPADSPYWDAKKPLSQAQRVRDEALAAQRHAAARAKAAVRPAWIEGYRDRASRAFAIEDQLIEALIELEQWCIDAEEQSVTGLPWIAPGQMSMDDLRTNQAARRLLVEQCR